MQITEATFEFLESHIQELADMAFRQDFWKTLVPVVVLVDKDGQIIGMFPEDSHKVIKQQR